MINISNLKIAFVLVAAALALLFLCEQRIRGLFRPETEAGVTAVAARNGSPRTDVLPFTLDEEMRSLPGSPWNATRIVAIAAISLFSAVVIGRIVRISRTRHELMRYASFLKNSFKERPVDPLLYRKWRELVYEYNRSRRIWPFSLLWRKMDVEVFKPRAESENSIVLPKKLHSISVRKYTVSDTSDRISRINPY